MQARAVTIQGKGDVDALHLGTIEVRAPGPGEVRVAIAAAGLNRADILQRRGFYPAPKGVAAPDVPGLEYAGTVEALGPEVDGVREGDAVMGITGGGAMASHLVVHARELIRVPQGMSLTDAAAVPEVFLTAYDALFLQARLSLGERLLVHAVGSGVGTAATQLAAHAGAHVIGTSRTEDKLQRCAPLGMAQGVLVKEGAFAEALGPAKGTIEVILDGVGAAYLADNCVALAPQGRLVILGLMGGAKAEAPLGLVLAKRLTIMGTVLRSRPLEEKAALARRFEREIVPLFERGALRPIVDTVIPMTQVREAHQRMESNASFGKIVLSWQ